MSFEKIMKLKVISGDSELEDDETLKKVRKVIADD